MNSAIFEHIQGYITKKSILPNLVDQNKHSIQGNQIV